MSEVLERLTLGDAARVLGLSAPLFDAAFTGVSIDSRSLRPGELFVALGGPNFDGHDFVQQAAARGAAGAVVSRPVSSDIPLLRVADTHAALIRLARARRRAFRGRVLAVTGSNGKTTVKEMTAAILARRGAVLATEGNLNNDIGVPLTLLRLEPGDDFAMIEMGANHPGEIALLADIAHPEVAIVTNAGAAHLEGFGDLDTVARSKGELFAALPAEGVAVINGDDPYAPLWRELAGQAQVMEFALTHPDAHVRAEAVHAEADGMHFRLLTPRGECALHLGLHGRHMVANALAATAAALAVDVELVDIRQALEDFRPVNGRLQVLAGVAGATLIDDSYNANPDSFRMAIDVLAALPGERILVVGEMLELGEAPEAAHREVGRYARASGIDRLCAVGAMAAHACEGFGDGEAFASQAACVQHLRTLLSADTTVLVKGSRGARMENIVRQLVAETASTAPVAEG